MTKEEKKTDDEGCCTVCGLESTDPNGTEHECPPGFLISEETTALPALPTTGDVERVDRLVALLGSSTLSCRSGDTFQCVTAQFDSLENAQEFHRLLMTIRELGVQSGN